MADDKQQRLPWKALGRGGRWRQVHRQVGKDFEFGCRDGMKLESRQGSHPPWLHGLRRGLSLTASECKGVQSTGQGVQTPGFSLNWG